MKKKATDTSGFARIILSVILMAMIIAGVILIIYFVTTDNPAATNSHRVKASHREIAPLSINPEDFSLAPMDELALWLEKETEAGRFSQVAQVRELLRTAPAGIKLRCMDYLVAAGDIKAAPILSDLNLHLDPQVRLGAMAARRKLGDLKDISAWLEALENPDPEFPQEGAYGIAAAGRTDLIDKVVPLLKSPHRAVCVEAAFSLVDLHWSGAPEAFGHWAYDDDYLHQEAGIRAWPLAEPDQALHKLAELTKHPDKELADLALHQIVKIDSPKVIPLLKSMSTGSEDIKLWAIYFLRKMGTPKAAKALEAFQNDQTPTVQFFLTSDFAKIELWDNPKKWDYSVFLPGDLEAKPSRERLVKLLSHKNTFVRIQALQMMAAADDATALLAPSALEKIIALSSDSHTKIRFLATVILSRQRREKAKETLIVLSADPMARIRQTAIWGLGNFVDQPKVRRVITSAVMDKSQDVQAAALLALARSASPEDMKILLRAANDPDFSIRAAAMYSFAFLASDNDDAKAAIEKGLGDVAGWVRLSAVFGASRFHDNCPMLTKAVKDESYYVRAAALPALAAKCPEIFRNIVRDSRQPAAILEPILTVLKNHQNQRAWNEISYIKNRYYELDLALTYDHIRDLTVLEAKNATLFMNRQVR